jgi:hypothetical protein
MKLIQKIVVSFLNCSNKIIDAQLCLCDFYDEEIVLIDEGDVSEVDECFGKFYIEYNPGNIYKFLFRNNKEQYSEYVTYNNGSYYGHYYESHIEIQFKYENGNLSIRTIGLGQKTLKLKK